MAAMASIAAGSYIRGQQLGAGAPVAVLARHRAAVGGDQLGRLLDERPVDRPPVGPVEREVDADVEAAVAEVAVGDAAQPVGGQQGLEVAQVGAEPVGGTAASSQPAQAGAPAGLRPPNPAPSSRMRQMAAASAGSARTRLAVASPPAVATSRPAAASASAAVAPASSTSSQPPPSGSSGTARPRRRTTSTMRASMPSRATGRRGRTVPTASAAVAMSG